MARICIDAGHYGKYNRSPGVSEYYESNMAWRLSQLQKKHLEKLGHSVIMTRNDQNKDLALQVRGQTSRGCDLFISNHSNAVGSKMNESVSYAAVYHLVDDETTKCDDISKEFAEKIAPVIGDVMGVSHKVVSRKANSDRNKDGALNDNYYGVLHGARLVETPGLILEHGFHTHTETAKWLLDEDNLDKLAKAEAECIDAFFGKEEEPGKNETSTFKPFTVRVKIKNLNIRKGPGTNYGKLKDPIKPNVYTIVEVKNGPGSKLGWGRLKSGVGWISLDYAEKI